MVDVRIILSALSGCLMPVFLLGDVLRAPHLRGRLRHG